MGVGKSEWPGSDDGQDNHAFGVTLSVGSALLGEEMIRRALFFLAPGRVEVREEKICKPAPGQVLAETLVSGISAGSELLVYCGQVPQEMPIIPEKI